MPPNNQIIADLQSPDWLVRHRALFHIKPYNVNIVGEHLIRCASDTNDNVRHTAIDVIGNCEYAAGVPALIHALANDDDLDIRSAAAFALGEIGDRTTVEALIDALGQDDSDTRRAAAQALGKIGDMSALDALDKYEYEDDPHARTAMRRAMRDIRARNHTT